MIRTRKYKSGSVYSFTRQLKTRKVKAWRYEITAPTDFSDPRSEPKRYTGTAPTQAEAVRKLDDLKAQIRAGKRTQKTKDTFATYAQNWLASKRLASSTLAGYEKNIRNHIIPALGNLTLDELTATKINSFYADLLKNGKRNKSGELINEPLSPNTVNKVHQVLAAILDSAVDDEYITTNPAKKSSVHPPTAKEIAAAKVEIEPWTADELKAFLAWDSETYQDHLYPLWYIYAKTGIRRSEGVALRWSDLNPDTKTLAVRRAADPKTTGATKTPKSGKSRVIDLSDDDVALLKSWKATRAQLSFELVKPNAYIFGNDNGSLRTVNDIGKQWARRVRQAQADLPNLRIIKLHDVRHTHASLLLQAGVHPKVVQERLGHSTISITMNIYSHVMPTMQRAAVDSLSALLA